jgi:hypothetical protein
MSTDLNPDFPVVTGEYLLTKGWHVSLRDEFNRRIEDGSLVLWRPELTFWINAWNNEGQASVATMLERLVAGASAERTEEQIEKTGTMARLVYELPDEVNGYVIYPAGYLQMSAYYDTPEARTLACEIIRSVRYL